MRSGAQRFFIRYAGGRMIVGNDKFDVARATALNYDEGTHLIDTNAQAYHPIALQ